MGLNGLYLNLAGREEHGIVAPGAERDRLLEELARRLGEFRDPETGELAIADVPTHRDRYSGDLRLRRQREAEVASFWPASDELYQVGVMKQLVDLNDRAIAAAQQAEFEDERAKAILEDWAVPSADNVGVVIGQMVHGVDVAIVSVWCQFRYRWRWLARE